jgi:hypothetical protein
MRIPPMSQVCSGLLCGLLILIVGCSNPSSQSLDSLSITATPATVSVGAAVTLHAMVHLSDGTTQDVTSSTQWTLSNPSLATLGGGVLTSKAPGTLTVQGAYVEVASSTSTANATAQNLGSSAQVTITPASTTPTPTQNIPTITWNTPAPIPYGTALSNVQLNAAANVPGSFVYAPAAGTVLQPGSQTLSTTFSPTDTTTYAAATSTVQLTVTPPTVTQTTPVITWPPPAAIPLGTALSAAQLNATANVAGTFSYNPPAGTVLGPGTQQLTATFTPSDPTTYSSATAHNSVSVSGTSSGDLDGSTDWEWNHDPGTPGSSTGSTAYPISSPAMDGAARKFYFTYSSSGGEIYHLSFAKDTTATHFVYDTYIYLTDPSQVQNIELDMNQVTSDGKTVILATQCASGSGTWEWTAVSNGGTHWHPSNIPCSPKTWTANTWHHVQIATHRDDAGNVTHDWVSLDGTTSNFQNAVGPSAESLGWAMGDLLLNFQLDGAGSGAITAYIDEMTIYRW